MLIKNTVSLLLATSLLTACGSGEEALSKAAEGRWQALIQGNMEEAYQYYTDAFQKTTSQEMFKHKVHSGLWKKVKVKQIQCVESGKRCDVAVDVAVVMRMPGLSKPMESHTTLHEVWVRDGWFSDWRYVDE
ncbi:hypothetical protein J9253_13005 [Thiothrix litoralis]|jgi:hypothetical protein|uniref:Uncharacterized protein n=1 Tax=Thiothrix litoralis TaxID=2891210 RepID=A0ABX7WP51_9GAMM|nr:hypothetical protein [Thiothrix litoralis]QTR44931.1 hypothetical protein J9253_13005 [Thiothrix litoralis]